MPATASVFVRLGQPRTGWTLLDPASGWRIGDAFLAWSVAQPELEWLPDQVSEEWLLGEARGALVPGSEGTATPTLPAAPLIQNFVHTWSLTIKNTLGQFVVTDRGRESANGQDIIDTTVPAGGSREIDLPIEVARIVSFVLEADQPLTLRTNSAVSPAQEFELQKGKALWWNVEQPYANPLTTDITAFFFANTGGLPAHVKASFLIDESA